MAKAILHMLFPGANASPFDINMAVDAGFDIVIPYTGIDTGQVTALVQDAIFSRPPKSFNRTGVFIGGNDVNTAADMIDAARGAMVPPFELAVLADPNGAYTTSAALVALVEHHLDGGYNGRRVVIFGGGPVGFCAAVLVARHGGDPVLARLTPGSKEKQAYLQAFSKRYELALESVDARDDDARAGLIVGADVIMSTAKAGIEVLGSADLDGAEKARVAADVNAVPPAGIAGVESGDNGVPVRGHEHITGIGALAIGGIKYKVQRALLEKMMGADSAVVLDFPDALEAAREVVQG